MIAVGLKGGKAWKKQILQPLIGWINAFADNAFLPQSLHHKARKERRFSSITHVSDVQFLVKVLYLGFNIKWLL